MDIIAKELSYVYYPNTPFEKSALHKLNLEIASGQWTAVIGRTGSGKSTFIQHLNGLLKPTAGELHVGSVLFSNKSKNSGPLFQDVGLVFQFPEHQLFEDTVFNEMAFGPKQLGWSEAHIQRRVYDMLAFVGLNETLIQNPPFTLSGGQKRRLVIASVLVMQPQLLILDEPTAGLDPQGKKMILQLLNDWLNQDSSRSIIMISHQMDDVAEYADEVIVFADGEVKRKMDPLTLYTTYKTELLQLGLRIPEAIHLVSTLNEKLEANGMDPIQLISPKQEHVIRALIEVIKDKVKANRSDTNKCDKSKTDKINTDTIKGDLIQTNIIKEKKSVWQD